MEAQRNEEQWRSVNGYVDYQVSNCGRVRRVKNGRIVQGVITDHGYRRVSIKGKHLRVHRLVAEAFIDNPDNKLCVDHINGNKLDNAVSNLRWATYQENARNKSRCSTGSSRYKGVFKAECNKWRAVICVNGQRRYLGWFDDEREAGLAYNAAARETFGEFAKLNDIPDE
jgi:hypothetical protein